MKYAVDYIINKPKHEFSEKLKIFNFLLIRAIYMSTEITAVSFVYSPVYADVASSIRPKQLDQRCDVSRFSKRDFDEYAKLDAYTYRINCCLIESTTPKTTFDICKRSIKMIETKLHEKYGHTNALDIIADQISMNDIFIRKFLASLFPVEYEKIPQITEDLGEEVALGKVEKIRKASIWRVASTLPMERPVEAFVIKFPDGISQRLYPHAGWAGNENRSSFTFDGFGITSHTEGGEQGTMISKGHVHSDIILVALLVNTRALIEWEKTQQATKELIDELNKFPAPLISLMCEYQPTDFKRYDHHKFLDHLFNFGKEVIGSAIEKPFKEVTERIS